MIYQKFCKIRIGSLLFNLNDPHAPKSGAKHQERPRREFRTARGSRSKRIIFKLRSKSWSEGGLVWRKSELPWGEGRPDRLWSWQSSLLELDAVCRSNTRSRIELGNCAFYRLHKFRFVAKLIIWQKRRTHVSQSNIVECIVSIIS